MYTQIVLIDKKLQFKLIFLCITNNSYKNCITIVLCVGDLVNYKDGTMSTFKLKPVTMQHEKKYASTSYVHVKLEQNTCTACNTCWC